jgi:hypothetical protein
MQSEQRAHGWTNSLGAQMAVATVAVVAVIAIAWFFVF